MSLIQGLLLIGTFFGLWAYFSFFKSITRNRIFLLSFGAVGLYFVIRPNDLSSVAHLLGVGRGTDLLLYLSLLFGFFFSLSLNAKVALLERDRTQLVRELAILESSLLKH